MEKIVLTLAIIVFMMATILTSIRHEPDIKPVKVRENLQEAQKDVVDVKQNEKEIQKGSVSEYQKFTKDSEIKIKINESNIGDTGNSNTDFMSGHYGIFNHYVKGWHNMKSADWDEDLNAFNISDYADNVQDEGANWVIFTLGQGTGYWCAPSNTFDSVLQKAGMPKRSPARDLPSELYDALHPKGIKLMLYFCCDPSWDDAPSRKALNESNDNIINDKFRQHVIDMAREWSDHYGSKVAGWFIDGFGGEARYSEAQKQSFADALKHGNPNSVIAFNGNDLLIRKMGDYEDYTSGEQMNDVVALGTFPESRWFNGLQWHICTFLGNGTEPGDGEWGSAGCKYDTQKFINYNIRMLALGGAATFDQIIYRDGSFDPAQHSQLVALNNAVYGSSNKMKEDISKKKERQ